MEPEAADHRCPSHGRLPSGQWKRCIRETDHPERHVWLESFARVGGRPIVVVWRGPDSEEPIVGEVDLPPGNYVNW